MDCSKGLLSKFWGSDCIIARTLVGCKRLIFPEANRKDFDELPPYLKKDLDVHFARVYEDVYNVAFGTQTRVGAGQDKAARVARSN